MAIAAVGSAASSRVLTKAWPTLSIQIEAFMVCIVVLRGPERDDFRPVLFFCDMNVALEGLVENVVASVSMDYVYACP